jgi:hypothetical protein
MHVAENEIFPSRTPLAISLSSEGENAGNADGHYSKSARRNTRSDLDPPARSFNPVRDQDGPSDLGLGRG